ncbi:MAG: carbon-nitrogen hydrolase family protein [Sulfolobales archaeon]|nr:carbon-nitrogen hydrolase family protein [Sulfolobales archaeon]
MLRGHTSLLLFRVFIAYSQCDLWEFLGKYLRVGILQFGSSTDKIRNLERIFSIVKKVEADVVVLPEYSMFAIENLSPPEVHERSEDLDSFYLSEFRRFARENSVYVLTTIFERASHPKVFNTAVLISPHEEIVAIYRKIHLFNAYGVRESDYMVAGDSPSKVTDLAGVRAAIAICFDLRFPELFRHYALQGAEVVFVPSAWYSGSLKEETLEFLSRSRASENTYYLVVANQFGQKFAGRSMVVDPLGVVLLDLGIGEKYVEFEIDLNYVYEARRTLPLLSLRREDIYTLKFTSRNT